MRKLLFQTVLFAVICSSCSSSSSKGTKFPDNSEINEEPITEVIVKEQTKEEQIVEEPKVEEPSYLLTPGVAYTAYQMIDAWGGKERHTIELTVYKDGSCNGKIINTAFNESRNNEETSITSEFEGTWYEASKHDKKTIELTILWENGDTTDAYIDEDQNIHCKELFKEPVKLDK